MTILTSNAARTKDSAIRALKSGIQILPGYILKPFIYADFKRENQNLWGSI
jgi:hypothetical protein